MMRPGQVSKSPTERHTSNSDPLIEMGGKIARARAPERMSALPGNFRREMA